MRRFVLPVVAVALSACGARSNVLEIEPTLPPIAPSNDDASAPTEGGGACESAGGVVLASNQGAPSAIALDSDYVYWTNFTSRSIARVAKTGGPVVTLATSSDVVSRVAVNSTNVYWASYQGDDGDGTVSIMTVPKSGGTPVTVTSATTFIGGISNFEPDGINDDPIAVDESNVYFATEAPSVTGTTLLAAPIAGGSPVTLASNEWNIDDIELDEKGVYWTSTNGDTTAWLLRSVRKTGGAPTTIVSEPFGGRSFGIGGGALVWAAWAGPQGQDAIRRQHVNSPIQTIALTSDWPDSIVADDTNVYWVDYPEYAPCSSEEWLYLASVGGGNAQAVTRVAGSGTIGHGVQFAKLAIDDEAVYWTALADGTVMKTRK